MMAPLSESPIPDPSPKEDVSSLISESYEQYLKKQEDLPTPEEKIAFGLRFMREAISQEGTPCFREFWEARRQLLFLFKQNLNPAIRSKLWDEYVELTVEARRLKDILEEESAFAMEQIDLAIQALEQDLAQFETPREPVLPPEKVSRIEDKAHYYEQLQRELHLLHTLAARLNGLRKEIIKTEMRIRFKTKFFKRLYALGDRIFPKRKERIDQVSEEFQRDVEQFFETYFHNVEVTGAPYYVLREEIKAFQGLAKLLTLNTNVFTATRLKLSECWDKIKVLEKTHKMEVQQKRQAQSENYSIAAEKIAELKGKIEGMDLKQLDAAIDEITNEVRSLFLDREDIRLLRQEMQQLRAPFLAKLEEQRKESERLEKEKIQLRKDKAAALKERIANLQKESNESSFEQLTQSLEEIRRELQELSLSKFEQHQFDRLLRPLKDSIAERKESAILNLNEDDRLVLLQLREVLDQRKQRRAEIKEQFDAYRKIVAGSGLDFEKAMMVREQMDLEKERLEKINGSIAEIEQKISDIEGNA